MSDKIPDIGFGLWKIAPEDCADVVYEAIRAGYRHFDSAADYANEKQVGEGLSRAFKDGLCTREDLWITSKLWNTYHAPEHVELAFNRTLSDLGLEYLDLYLIHFPISLAYVPIEKRYPPEWVFDPDAAIPTMQPARVPLYETWAAMEKLVNSERTRKIGICNYNCALLHDLMAYAKIPPYVLQIEAHPFLTQTKLLAIANQYDVKVTAFSPLGALSYIPIKMANERQSVLNQSVVIDAANKHQKSPAQIVLRWGVQRGTAIIPKTVNPERMRENLDLYDFELSRTQMEAISALNQDQRFNDPGVFCELAFNTLFPIYD